MDNYITRGKSILENTRTNTVFIADETCEKTQCKGKNREHIQKVGELDINVMDDISLTLPEAIKVLKKPLNEDLGYKIGWNANLAMAFYDAFEESKDKKDIVTIANNGANRFIEQLIK
jgi:hypothetical protein